MSVSRDGLRGIMERWPASTRWIMVSVFMSTLTFITNVLHVFS